MDAMEKVLQKVAEHMIATFVTMEIQQAMFYSLGLTASKAVATSEASDSAGVAFAGTYAQVMQAVPWPFSLALAPEEAARAAALTEAGAAAFIAHGGMDYTPAETTYLLDKGERVVSPRQNQDLTDFLKKSGDGSQGGAVTIQRLDVHVMENATSSDAFLRMNKIELRNALGQPIIDALDEMYKVGIKPKFANQLK